MRLLKLFQVIPTLPAGVLVVMLAALALVVYGGLCVSRRRIGRGIAFGGAGVLVLWGLAIILVSDGESRPPTAAEARTNMRVAAAVVGLCIAGGGAAALAGALGMIGSTRRFLKIAVSAPGQIVDFATQSRTQANGQTSESHSAVVAFRTEDGQEHRFESQTWSQLQPDVGRRVSVLYDPKNPSEARRRSFFHFWIVPLFIGLMGLVFLAAGLAVVFVEPG